MGFDVTPTVTADWTNNLDALDTGINRLRPGGGTALFDSVYTACRDKLLTERGREPVRKAMILISDGDDNQSRVRPDEAIKMCERSETIIYAISTNWTPSRGKGDQVLQQMSDATGGETFLPAFGGGNDQQLPRDPGRTAQPVRAQLHARGLQGQRRLPPHLSLTATIGDTRCAPGRAISRPRNSQWSGISCSVLQLRNRHSGWEFLGA